MDVFPRSDGYMIYNRIVTHKRFFLFGLLFALYFSTRLTQLTKLPIFTDEAIYIRWGQIALQDSAQRFISLEDGKQPLFIWLMLPALRFLHDPLVAGRVVSVFAGFASLTGLIVLSSRLFGEKIAWWTGLLYIIIPFFVLYDRLALYDSLTTATMVWSLFLTICLAQTLRLDVALLLGMAIGAGLLTKSSAQFAMMFLPVTLLVFDWSRSRRIHRLLRWIGLAGIAVFLAIVIQTILRLSPLAYMVKLKNLTFIVSSQEFFADPLSRVVGNLRGLIPWFVGYVTVPFVFLLAIGILTGNTSMLLRKKILLLLCFFIPFLALAAFGIVLYPRFMLFMAAPLLPLGAFGLEEIRRRVIKSRLRRASTALLTGGALLLLAYPMFTSSMIILDPVNAPIPTVDRNQFMDDWPSGYGIPQVVAYLREQGKSEKIFVGTEGTFGLTPFALDIYLRNQKNIEIRGYWPIPHGIEELKEIAGTGKPTFLLLKDTQTPDPQWPVELIARYRKGRGNVYMGFYRVIPKR